MTEHKFHNEYDIILHMLSWFLDPFEKGDQLLSAQSIWWTASIIQFTEILIYYRDYTIFHSDFVKDLVVMPLPFQLPLKRIVPESEIPELDLAEEINFEL